MAEGGERAEEGKEREGGGGGEGRGGGEVGVEWGGKDTATNESETRARKDALPNSF